MPTLSRKGGVRGLGMLATPGKKIGASRGCLWLSLTVGSKPFRSRPFSTYNATITGITKDSSGNPLGSCVVQLFRTVDDLIISEVISDGSGNYILYPTVGGPFYIVAYKTGSPDVAGTTVNTLFPI